LPVSFVGRKELRREQAEKLFGPANENTARVVYIQCLNRGPTDCRMALQLIPAPSEIRVPVVLPRVKEGNDRTARRIDHFRSISFMEIAGRTAPGKVIYIISAAARSRDNVLDVKSRALKSMVHPAIFATPARSCLD